MLTNIPIAVHLFFIIEAFIVTSLLSGVCSIDSSLIAFTLTFFWLLLQADHGARYAIIGVLIPYIIGVLASVYQTRLAINFDLLYQLLAQGDRSIANSTSLNTFERYYCPIAVFGYALRSKMANIVDDLSRYGMWKYKCIRYGTEFIVKVLLFVDYTGEVYNNVSMGLRTRYIDLSTWRSKIFNIRFWAPVVLRSLILAALCHYEYLNTTGIRLHKVRKYHEEQLRCVEKIAIILLLLTTIPYFIIRLSH